jgi:formate dehydrogenase major subunit
MGLRRWVSSWPVYRQLTGPDRLGRGRAAESPPSASLEPRTQHATTVAASAGITGPGGRLSQV